MGLFDSIAGQVIGSFANSGDGRHAELINAIGGMINNPQTGGLSGLVNMFEQQGLGHVVGSWISNGQNLPISADQLRSVLGNDQVQALAQKLGINPQEMSGHLAELLPQVIDKLTPNGQLPQGGGGLGALVGMLKG